MTNDNLPRRPTVAIVGGGFSGAAVAYHLHRLAPGHARIVVLEPRDEIGRGLAYSASDPAHRINVPAARMSIDPDDPGHFDRWLQASGALDRDPSAHIADGRDFPARRVFGNYVSDTIRTAGPDIEHIQATVHSIIASGSRYQVYYGTDQLLADIVVLAVCHEPPAAPSGFSKAVLNHDRFIANPWIPGALDGIASDSKVLIIGTGLTMADIVASLDRNSFTGTIVALSRRGLRSKGHPEETKDPYGDFLSPRLTSSISLLRSIRRSVRQAGQEGASWHSVLDQVRLQGRCIWQNLKHAERERLLRHLRPFWDTHRFRIAPQPEAAIARRLRDGCFHVFRGKIVSAVIADGQFQVELKARGQINPDEQSFDYIVSATGPSHGTVFATNALLTDLQSRGLARPDLLKLGIDVTEDGRAIKDDGEANDNIYVAGPLARGTFGELMGLPDVAIYAVRLSETVLASLADAKQRSITSTAPPLDRDQLRG